MKTKLYYLALLFLSLGTLIGKGKPFTPPFDLRGATAWELFLWLAWFLWALMYTYEICGRGWKSLTWKVPRVFAMLALLFTLGVDKQSSRFLFFPISSLITLACGILLIITGNIKVTRQETLPTAHQF